MPSRPTGVEAPTGARRRAEVRRALLRGWGGVLTTAAGMLATALGVATVAAVCLRPALLSDWQTLVLAAGLATASFGADVRAEHADVTVDVGAFPLTVTILALGVGVALFRRATRSRRRGSEALVDAARVALVVAVAMTVVALVFRTEVAGVAVAPRAGSAFAMTLLMTFAVLAVTVLLRREWLHSPLARALHDRVRAPLVGLAALVACLPLAGTLAAVCVLVLSEDGSAVTQGLGALGFGAREKVGAVVAFGGNLGVWSLTLGSLGEVGVFGFGRLRAAAAVLSSSVRVPDAEDLSGRLGFLAGDLGLTGLWVSVVLAPLVLGTALAAVTRSAGRGPSAAHRERLAAAGLWLAGLLVAVPALVRLSNAHVGVDVVIIGEDGGGLGARGLGATLLVACYAVLLTLAALLLGALAEPRRRPGPPRAEWPSRGETARHPGPPGPPAGPPPGPRGPSGPPPQRY